MKGPNFDFEKSRFLFVDVALRAASTLKNRDLFVFVKRPRSVKTPLFGWIRATGVC